MSLSAKIVVSALRAVKKTGLLPGIGDPDKEMARARAYNQKHPYREPKSRSACYRTLYIGDDPVLVIRPRQAVFQERRKAILFLHGGGDKDAWRPEVSFAKVYGKRTGADVFYPIYPPFTEKPAAYTADLIYRIYQKLEQKYGGKNIVVVGGSYGGLLALQLITWINRKGNAVDMPNLMLLNSPFAFPETDEEWALARLYEKTDPMVPEGSVQLMLYEMKKGGPDVPDYALYPDKMDFHHAPETYAWYTEETCACVSEAIQKTYERDGAGERMHLHIEPGMMHCYACAPVFPESRRDFNRQIELIRKI